MHTSRKLQDLESKKDKAFKTHMKLAEIRKKSGRKYIVFRNLKHFRIYKYNNDKQSQIREQSYILKMGK